jgi:hypothetical protein
MSNDKIPTVGAAPRPAFTKKEHGCAAKAAPPALGMRVM